MRPDDKRLARQIYSDLVSFTNKIPLIGIKNEAYLNSLIEQIIDSTRRIKYVTIIRDRENSDSCVDPYLQYFNPLKAAAWYRQNGDINEACWLVFLSVHFGKNKNSKWKLVQNVYGGLQNGNKWDWARTSSNPKAFRTWLHGHLIQVKKDCYMGNHRRYVSLDALNENGTGAVIESYVNWVNSYSDHQTLINQPISSCQTTREAFDYLYRKLNHIRQFGRLAKFDFLTMLGKLELAEIEPGSLYLDGATGPLRGARMLFGGDPYAPIDIKTLDFSLDFLEKHLNLYFGMQVLEDALCNWQKSPERYVRFIG
jgi:hypothetical protein